MDWWGGGNDLMDQWGCNGGNMEGERQEWQASNNHAKVKGLARDYPWFYVL